MRKKGLILGLMLVVLMGLLVGCGLKSEVTAVMTKYFNAMEAQDYDTMDSLIASNATITFTIAGQPIPCAEIDYLTLHYLIADMFYNNIKVDAKFEKISSAGKNMATVKGNFKYTGVSDGVYTTNTFEMKLQESGDSWVIIEINEVWPDQWYSTTSKQVKSFDLPQLLNNR